MSTSTSNGTPLNVIWILVDSVRNYRSGGDDRDKLEIMEKLGPQCIDFETVVTSAPSSLMSFSAIMTATPAYLIARDFDNFDVYEGKDMLSAHRGMNIDDAEFVAVLDDAMAALDKNGIGQREKEEALFILYGLKAEIVHV